MVWKSFLDLIVDSRNENIEEKVVNEEREILDNYFVLDAATGTPSTKLENYVQNQHADNCEDRILKIGDPQLTGFSIQKDSNNRKRDYKSAIRWIMTQSGIERIPHDIKNVHKHVEPVKLF